MKRGVVALVFSIIIVTNALLAYQPHFSNPFPLIGDEYVHISFGEYILEEGKLPFTNPYFLIPYPHTNFESGFHFLLAGIFAVIPGEPVLFYKYFVILFSVINSVLVFALVRAMTQNDGAALAAMFFFGTLKSAGGILTHQYFVPLTLGVTLLLLLFLIFHLLVWKRSWRYMFLFIGTLGITALTYPPALFFFLGTILVYLLFARHGLYGALHMTRYTFVSLLVLGVVFVVGLFISLLYRLGALDITVFSSSWEVIQMRYSLISFFGIIPSVFAAIGLTTVAFSKENSTKLLLYWFLFSLAALYGFHLMDASLLLPYPRLFLFYLVGVSMLAGIGFAASIQLVQGLFEIRYWKSFVILVVLGICAFHYAEVWKHPLSHHTILKPETFAALVSLKNILEPNAVIIADSAVSFAVYPVSQKHVVNLLSSNVGGGDVRAAQLFLKNSCAEKRSLIIRFTSVVRKPSDPYPPLYVLTDRKETCEFLTLVYGAGPYVYRLHR